MAGIPYKSRLTPYEREIAELRKGWPPTPYKEIAAILNEAHPGLNISPNAVWSFVKMRGGGGKKPKYQLPEPAPAQPELDARKEEVDGDIYDQTRDAIAAKHQQPKPKTFNITKPTDL